MSMSLAAILAESASRHPHKDALLFGETRVTYAELWTEARRYATVLRDRGIGPGDRVALLMPNVPDFPRVYYAALSLGAVVVPVHALLVGREIAYVLADSGAKVLIAGAPLLEQASAGAAEAGVALLATMGGDEVDRLDVLAASAEPVDSYVQREPEDPAVILYTCGTTGEPKGAVLTHLNMTMNAMISAGFVPTTCRPMTSCSAACRCSTRSDRHVVMNAARSGSAPRWCCSRGSTGAGGARPHDPREA